MQWWLGLVATDTSGDLSWWDRFLLKVEFVPVLSIWWVVGFLVAALLFLALAIYVRPKWWLFLFIPLIIVALVGAGGFAVNVKFKAYKTLGPMLGLDPYDTAGGEQLDAPSGSYPRGVVVDSTIPGTKSGLGALPVKVWLPPQWFTDQKRDFPVIYLMHGVPGLGVPVPGSSIYSGPGTLFTNASADDGAQKAATQRDQPVVLVAPVDSPLNADTECVDGAQGRWQTYLSQDVPAWVASHKRLKTGAANTAIAGYSMGGYCAQITALRNPSAYSVVGNFSGTPLPDYPPGMPALFGVPDATAVLAEYDSTKIVNTQPAARAVRLWLQVGAQDPSTNLATAQRTFADAAKAQGMTVVSIIAPGTHDFALWTSAFSQWIQWTAAQLYGEPPAPVQQ